MKEINNQAVRYTRAYENKTSTARWRGAPGNVGTSLSQPIITSQPQDHACCVGATATFTVGVSGQEPLSYQWQQAPDYVTYGDRPEGTNSTLVIANVQYSDSGYYRVIVTNAQGSATSGVARLDISTPPSISPAGQSTNVPYVVIGGTTGNRVVAAGSQ